MQRNKDFSSRNTLFERRKQIKLEQQSYGRQREVGSENAEKKRCITGMQQDLKRFEVKYEKTMTRTVIIGE